MDAGPLGRQDDRVVQEVLRGVDVIISGYVMREEEE